ncbi:MAG: SDR family oxidoreductase [Oscillospiraceae bacterium]|nr:SDR family oxidoreductase [Oscillospiraceae bacterium]
MEPKIAVVTGGSSGIGLETARALAAAGCRVYELSRRDFNCAGVTHLSADVTDEAAVQDAIDQILAETGRVDILVNCAGFGISGAVEFTELADAKRQMDVNFFGTVNTTKAVLGHMRRAGSGRVVNVSSVAAPAAIPFQAFYSASKAAVNDYSCALANEVRPYGVSVCAVMPGDIRTGFTAARKKSAVGDEAYGGRISRSVAKMERDEQGGMPPETAGAYIAKIALQKRVKPLYAIGLSYKCACFLCDALPCRLRNWAIGKLYA